jgi:hypothetical protein
MRVKIRTLHVSRVYFILQYWQKLNIFFLSFGRLATKAWHFQRDAGDRERGTNINPS